MTWRPTGLCWMFVCDIVSFGSPVRTDHARTVIREALYSGLRRGFDEGGVPFDACYHEDRGDGVMLVVPREYDVDLLITGVIDRLRAEIRRHNGVSSAAARIQLRVAVHAGACHSDGKGLVGEALNHAFRILDAVGLRNAVNESGADVGLIVSQRVYEDVVRPGRGLVDPGEYRQVTVEVKETATAAWIRVPAAPAIVPGAVVIPRQREPERDPEMIMFELAYQMLDIPLMAQERGREQVVGALPGDVAWRIPRGRDAITDTYNIIQTCLEYQGGLHQLHRAIKGFVGDSIAVHQLEQTIVRLLLSEREL